MNPLSDSELEAILKAWKPGVYDPPKTNIQAWIGTIESLCDMHHIPDTQRPQCAVKFVNGELRTQLENVLEDARARFGPIHWARFINFITEFDRAFREQWEELPFYKKHPKFIGAALGITGGFLLAPVAAAGVLTAVGFTSAGVAAGSLAATIQSIVYGGATGGLFSLLQSAGATMVLPSVELILTGATATGTGVALMAGDSATTHELLAESFVHLDSNDDGNLPPPHQPVP